MTLLIFGVLLWTLLHALPIFAPKFRDRLVDKLGPLPYKGLFALATIASLALTVWGWQSADPDYLYDLPYEVRHVSMLIMFFAVVMFGAAMGKSRIRQFTRNAMLIGMILWAGSHLLVNGDTRSLVLFGGFGFWAIVSIFGTNARDGTYEKPATGGWMGELRLLVISLIAYGALAFGHEYFTGIPLF